MTATPKVTRREHAATIAKRCEDAYSSARYASWPEVARVLLRMGFTDAETETVMRSKITRWAGDMSDRPYGKVPAKAVRDYIKNDEARRGYLVRKEIADWTAQEA